MLQEYDEDWLVGENGIIYRLPPDVWHYLVTEIAERRLGDPPDRFCQAENPHENERRRKIPDDERKRAA